MFPELTNEWHVLRRRHALGHHHLKDGEGQQHRDPERDLLPRIRREIEAQWGQEGDEETG